MNQRAFRCLPVSLFILALLLILAGAALAAENPRVTPQARAAFLAVAPPQAAGCPSCALAHQKCSSTCFGEAEKGQMGACLTACDNAAATCSCDGPVTLRSEDLVQRGWASVTKAAACHGNVSCQPNFPSCASWSSYSACGDPFCDEGPRCGDCFCEGGHCFCDPGPALKSTQERFRVCFDQFGNSCTEWQVVLNSRCGC